MDIQEYKIRLTFTEPLLGSAPLNKDVYNDYIRSKEPTGDLEDTQDEIETIGKDDKGKTGFHRLPCGTPIIYDYVVRGFFKDACGMLGRMAGSESKKLRAYKKVIDGLVFVEPRQIPIKASGEMTELQRPLRAQTMQGERITLACSEMLPAQSEIEFTVCILGGDNVPETLLREWLDYGQYRGFGQWRNASFGRYTYELEKC